MACQDEGGTLDSRLRSRSGSHVDAGKTIQVSFGYSDCVMQALGIILDWTKQLAADGSNVSLALMHIAVSSSFFMHFCVSDCWLELLGSPYCCAPSAFQVPRAPTAHEHSSAS